MTEPAERPRCGDHVIYKPTGEVWLTAFSEGEIVVPAGLPIRMARVIDCEIIFRCSDHDHQRLVGVWEYAREDIRTPIIQRLYGKSDATAPVQLPSVGKKAGPGRRRRRAAAA
jgi:hypothetical protein